MEYFCKYAPAELAYGFGQESVCVNPCASGMEKADQIVHRDVCAFSRSLLTYRLSEPDPAPLLLTTCCDPVRRLQDALVEMGQKTYTVALPRKAGETSISLYAAELMRLIAQMEKELNRPFDLQAMREGLRKEAAAEEEEREKILQAPRRLALLGARVSTELMERIRALSPLPVEDLTCTGLRSAAHLSQALESACARADAQGKGLSLQEAMEAYAGGLLTQVPCLRMMDVSERARLAKDPAVCGIIYSTVSFCDFYGFEYASLREEHPGRPMLKLETDYTLQSDGQLITRIEAFLEELGLEKRKPAASETRPSGAALAHQKTPAGKEPAMKYFAGIDSGSTSTNCVILDEQKKIVGFSVVPTGYQIESSARKALSQALSMAGLQEADITSRIATGYGRAALRQDVSGDVTEITCHAKGAFFLDPSVRTVIDIGGQDSKLIRLDEKGGVIDFAMNDKCAAGTGRFLELMAASLGITLGQMSEMGTQEESEKITISSMCSVFAQSEVVSLIAEGKNRVDIVRGLDRSIAAKVLSLGGRSAITPRCMMTGGVARNQGVVRAMSEKIGENVLVPEEPEICGALGAALIALERQA